MKRILFSFVLFSLFTINITNIFGQNGYVLEVDNGQVYIDLSAPVVQAGDKLTVIKEGGYFIHPITKKKIKKQDEKIAILIVKETFDSYSLTVVSPPKAISKIQKGMIVIKSIDSSKKSKEENQLKKAIAISPLKVGNNRKNYMGFYASDLLAMHFLEQGVLRVIDRESLGLQVNEKSLQQVFLDDALINTSQLIGVDYLILGTIDPPDVVKTSTGIPLKGLVEIAETATGEDLGSDKFSDITIERLKARVHVSLRVVDVYTGEILFVCEELSEATGKASIEFERGVLGGAKIRGGATAFLNSITGKATQNALRKLAKVISEWSEGKIKSRTYSGQSVANSTKSKELKRPPESLLKIENYTPKGDSLLVLLNQSINVGKTLNVLMPIYSKAFNNWTGKYEKIGTIKVIAKHAGRSTGDLKLEKKSVNIDDIVRNAKIVGIKKLFDISLGISYEMYWNDDFYGKPSSFFQLESSLRFFPFRGSFFINPRFGWSKWSKWIDYDEDDNNTKPTFFNIGVGYFFNNNRYVDRKGFFITIAYEITKRYDSHYKDQNQGSYYYESYESKSTFKKVYTVRFGKQYSNLAMELYLSNYIYKCSEEWISHHWYWEYQEYWDDRREDHHRKYLGAGFGLYYYF